MKNNIIDSKLIQDKIKEYQSAENVGNQKIIVLQQELSKTTQQVATMRGAIAAMTELLPKEKKPETKKNIVEFKNKEDKNGKK